MFQSSAADAKVLFRIPRRDYLIAHDATWEHADPTYEDLFPEDA